MSQDDQHLKLLSIFHYVVGGLLAFVACFPLLYLAIGVILLTSPESFERFNAPPGHHNPGMAIMGLFMILSNGTIVLMGWTLAACAIAAGRCLTRRRSYTFCLVIACLLCIFLPFGTVLGVFTIIVLMARA